MGTSGWGLISLETCSVDLCHPDVARERDCEGELVECDIGQGFNFRSGTFDGAISVSVIQWLCNKDKNSHEPWKRLTSFFKSVYKCLKFGGRIVRFFSKGFPILS